MVVPMRLTPGRLPRRDRATGAGHFGRRLELTAAVRGVKVTAMQLTPAEITRLSPEERLRLIEQLWDSLADEDVPLPPAQATELERRLASFDADRARAVGWDELKTELTRRCP
jgi:putative addiction module component (TIGR02574 family)